MGLIERYAGKFLRWKEGRYHRKVEGVMKANGLYLPVLEMQGTDRDFCTLSLKLYRAGFKAGLAPSKIAAAVVQASSMCRLDRKRGLEGMEKLLGGDRQRAVSPHPLPDPGAEPALVAIRQEKAVENLRIISAVTAQILDEISQAADSAGRDRLEGPLGSFGKGLAKMVLTDVALLVFGIHAICKIRHNPTYFASEEHAGTRVAFLDNLVEQILGTVGQMGVKVVGGRILRDKVLAELLECEGNVRDFCFQLQVGNTTSPDTGLIATFVKRTTFLQISGRPVETLVHDYLRVVYDLIYVAQEPTEH